MTGLLASPQFAVVLMAVGISVTQEQNLNRHRAFGPTGEALDGTELRAHQHVGRVGGWGFGLPGGRPLAHCFWAFGARSKMEGQSNSYRVQTRAGEKVRRKND